MNPYPISIRIKILADLVLILLAIYLQNRGILLNGDFFTSENLASIFLGVASWLLIGAGLGLYKDLRDHTFAYEWMLFVKTLIIYLLVITFFNFQLLSKLHFNRTHLVIHASVLFIFIPLEKLVIRLVLKKLRNSSNVMRKVLIVGADDQGIDFYQRFVKNHQYGYKLTGFVDDKANPALNGHYLGKVADIEQLIPKHDVDDIIVTLPITDQSELQKIVTAGQKEGKRVRIVPHYDKLTFGRLAVDKLGSLPIITLRALPLDSIDSRIYKRIFDVIFSIMVITFVLSWLTPVIAILIKLSSRGPVFFRQERWGLNNKPIICYKFRTMVVSSKDVDAEGKYQQARKNDARITRIGRFLRKTSLDEMPQFFNVLLGSMSVIGPRPHPVPLNVMSKHNVENYMMRHWVKPGITGWAQVNGYRGETRNPYMMQKRVEHDLWYIENWTFWLDLQIIVQTLVNIVKGEENAY